MKTVFLLLLVIVITLVAAGVVVLHHQGTQPCITYYTKDGSRELYKDCK